MSFLSDVELSIPCGNEKCKREFKATIAHMQTSPSRTCPACGVTTRYNASEFNESMKEVDKSMAELNKTFEDLNKSLKFNF